MPNHFSIFAFGVKKSTLCALMSLALSVGMTHARDNHSAYDRSFDVYGGVPSIAADGTGFGEERLNRQIAEWALQQINGSMSQIHDPWAVETIYRMTSQMNATVRTQPLLATPIINDNSVNAFAVTGGLIAINTGTIFIAKSLDEPASVLAHEVAHLAQRHHEHRSGDRGRLMAMQVGGFLAAIAAAAAGSGDAALAVMAGSQTAAADTAAAHSREHEREADRLGMQILASSGYDARAMPRFFGRLQQQSALNASNKAFVPSFVRSHPMTAERLSEANSRAASLPIVSALNKEAQTVLFDMLYWRLQYLSRQAGYQELNSASKHSHGAKMAIAAWLSDNQRFDEAHRVLGTLNALPSQTKHALEPLLCITNAHVHYQQKNYQKALEHIQGCQNVYPERRDLKLYLADTLIYAGRPSDAQVLLKSLTDAAPHDIKAWDMTQRSYQMLSRTHGDTAIQELAAIHALRARGLTELWSAKYDQALSSLTQAKSLSQAKSAYRSLGALINQDITKVELAKDFKPR